MIEILKKYNWLLIAFLLTGCAKLDDLEQYSNTADYISYFDFSEDFQEWEAGFSDYPVEKENLLDLSIEHASYPENSNFEGKGIRLSGRNPHKDLFYYVKRKIKGLNPNTLYQVDYEFLVFPEVLEAPADSQLDRLYFKAGALDYEPLMKVRSDVDYPVQYLMIDIDKGYEDTQIVSGTDIVTIGNFSINNEKEISSSGLVTGNSYNQKIQCKTNQDGEMWLVLGIDSGEDAYLSFCFGVITVLYTEIN